MPPIPKSTIISAFGLILQACVSAPGHSNEQERVTIELPHYPPRITVVNSAGESMMPEFEREVPIEFRGLYLSVAKDPSSSTGYLIPKSICDSKRELELMLPAYFYKRLIVQNDKFGNQRLLEEYAHHHLDMYDDAVVERYWDLADFLLKAWDLWGDANPIKRELLEKHGRYWFVEGSPDLLFHLMNAQRECGRE